jgi:hypothetical protein
MAGQRWATGWFDEDQTVYEPRNRRSQRCTPEWRALDGDREDRSLRSSAGARGSAFTRLFVHPTCQHTNPQPVIEGRHLRSLGCTRRSVVMAIAVVERVVVGWVAAERSRSAVDRR